MNGPPATDPGCAPDELRQRAALAEAQLAAAEVEIEAWSERHARLLTLLGRTEDRRAEADHRRAEAERWLAEHRNSLTWRMTEPLRALVRRARARGARR